MYHHPEKVEGYLLILVIEIVKVGLSYNTLAS